jgi:hypothetical protein
MATGNDLFIEGLVNQRIVAHGSARLIAPTCGGLGSILAQLDSIKNVR